MATFSCSRRREKRIGCGGRGVERVKERSELRERGESESKWKDRQSTKQRGYEAAKDMNRSGENEVRLGKLKG